VLEREPARGRSGPDAELAVPLLSQRRRGVRPRVSRAVPAVRIEPGRGGGASTQATSGCPQLCEDVASHLQLHRGRVLVVQRATGQPQQRGRAYSLVQRLSRALLPCPERDEGGLESPSASATSPRLAAIAPMSLPCRSTISSRKPRRISTDSLSPMASMISTYAGSTPRSSGWSSRSPSGGWRRRHPGCLGPAAPG
jgi:hypothetical protein